MRFLMRVGVVLLAAVALGGWSALPAQAAEPAGLSLELRTDSARYALGAPIALTLTVANRDGQPCRIAAMAAGTVKVIELTRDDQPVAPAFAEVAYTRALSEMLADATTTLPPGGRAEIAASADSGSDPAAIRFTTVDGLPGGGGAATLWPVATPGDYRLTAVYRTSPGLGESPVGCASTSSPATVEFTVERDFPGWLPWLIGGGVLAALLVGAVLLVMRRSGQRHQRGNEGAAAGGGARRGALGALLVVALVVGASVQSGQPAAAAPFVDGNAPFGFQSTFNACMGGFRAPGGDPAGLLKVLDKPNPRILVRPPRPIDETDSFEGASETDQVIYWSHIARKRELDPGVPQDACAQLYHEMAHARDFNTTGLDNRSCDKRFILTKEALATLAENQYRASRKPPLPLRRTYSGASLPETAKECEDRDPPVGKPPVKCTSNSGKAEAIGPDNCDKDLPPEPRDGSPGMSNGDPHLLSLDGHNFDFQAVGEFVAAQSATRDLVIQARQSPLPGSRVASVNTAVALQVAADRLQFAVVDGELRVWLNGTPQRWTGTPQNLPGGGRATRRPAPATLTPDGYTVRWPDGSLAWLDPLSVYGIRLYVALAPTRKGTVAGLLGNFDGVPDNDLRPRDGQQLPLTPTFEQLYRTFGDSWRISDAESLFTYDSGQTTATFTDRAFPDRPISVDDLDPQRRAAAQRICAATGMTDPVQLAACVLDVALSGDAAYAVNSVDIHANPVVPHGPAPTPVPGRPAGSAIGDGDAVRGEITAAATSVRYAIRADVGEEFYLADWHGLSDGCDQAFYINLVGVSTGNSPCTGQFVRFRRTDPAKPLELEIVSRAGATGAFSFRLITVKPRMFAIRYGDRVAPGGPLGAGSIDVRGREDTLAFDAQGATAVRLTGLPDCTTTIMWADLIDLTDARPVATGRTLCQEVSFTLDQPSHRYAIVVRSSDLTTGDYTLTLDRG